jgi:hypothetical protein
MLLSRRGCAYASYQTLSLMMLMVSMAMLMLMSMLQTVPPNCHNAVNARLAEDVAAAAFGDFLSYCA